MVYNILSKHKLWKMGITIKIILYDKLSNEAWREKKSNLRIKNVKLPS